jgi:hypothetical protein
MKRSSLGRGTSLYAGYRADLAYDRLIFWQREAERLEDHADTLRSKAARTRGLREAEKARKLADRAAIEFQQWQQRAETLAKREEEEARRRRRKKKPPKKKPPKKRKKKEPPKEPPRRLYEYLLKVTYEPGRRQQARAHAVWWDVRFRKLDGGRATEAELSYAIRQMHMGNIPNGWEVLSIAWDRGRRGGRNAVPEREATGGREMMQALASLGATMDSRGGIAWSDTYSEYIGANYTVGEEEFIP